MEGQMNYDDIDLDAPVPAMPTLREWCLVQFAEMLVDTKTEEDERAVLTVAREFVRRRSNRLERLVVTILTDKQRFLSRIMQQLAEAKTEEEEQVLLLVLQDSA
jgi:hypothetical protein